MRFSIRDLLWATLVVGLCLGWLLSDRAREAEHDEEFNTLYAQVKEAANMAEVRAEVAEVQAKLKDAANVAEAQEQARRLSELRRELGNQLSRRATEKAKPSVVRREAPRFMLIPNAER